MRNQALFERENGKSGLRPWNLSKTMKISLKRYNHKALGTGALFFENMIWGRTGFDGGESLIGCSGLVNPKTKKQ